MDGNFVGVGVGVGVDRFQVRINSKGEGTRAGDGRVSIHGSVDKFQCKGGIGVTGRNSLEWDRGLVGTTGWERRGSGREPTKGFGREGSPPGPWPRDRKEGFYQGSGLYVYRNGERTVGVGRAD